MFCANEFMPWLSCQPLYNISKEKLLYERRTMLCIELLLSVTPHTPYTAWLASKCCQKTLLIEMRQSIFSRCATTQNTQFKGILTSRHLLNQLWLRQFLNHWGRDKMATVSQTTLSNAFSWMKMLEFRLRFHWSLFLRVQLTIIQHWFRWWLGAVQATSHYLNQWWLDCRRIYASLGLNELRNYINIKQQDINIHPYRSSPGFYITSNRSWQGWVFIYSICHDIYVRQRYSLNVWKFIMLF